MSQMTACFRPLQGGNFSIPIWQKYPSLIGRFLLSPVKVFVLLAPILLFKCTLCESNPFGTTHIAHLKEYYGQKANQNGCKLDLPGVLLTAAIAGLSLDCWDQGAFRNIPAFTKNKEQFLIFLMDEKSLKMYLNAPQIFGNQRANKNKSKVSLSLAR